MKNTCNILLTGAMLLTGMPSSERFKALRMAADRGSENRVAAIVRFRDSPTDSAIRARRVLRVYQTLDTALRPHARTRRPSDGQHRRPITNTTSTNTRPTISATRFTGVVAGLTVRELTRNARHVLRLGNGPHGDLRPRHDTPNTSWTACRSTSPSCNSTPRRSKA